MAAFNTGRFGHMPCEDNLNMICSTRFNAPFRPRTLPNNHETSVNSIKTSATPPRSSASLQNPIAAASLLLQTLETGSTRLQRILAPPPPGYPPGPRTDVALDLLQDPLAFLENAQKQFGDVVGFTLAGERAVLITDPSAAKTVLVDSPDIYVKTGTAFFPGSSLAGNGLLVSDGEIWRHQRQLATPAFRRAAVERYATAMVDCTVETLLQGPKRWRNGAIRNVYADFNELTLKVTLSALFGSSNDELDSATAKEVTDSIREAFEYFSQRASSAFIIPEEVPTPDNLKFGAAVARLDKAVYGLIARRRAELSLEDQEENNSLQKGSSMSSLNGGNSTSGNRGRSDLLTALLLARDEGGTGMDDTSLRDELMTLLVAGQETSAILLGWTSALLAQSPEIQIKAAEEVAKVLNSQPPRPEDANNGCLQYLEAVILEALRILPPAYLVGRCTKESTVLGGYDLPKGTTVLVSPYVMHRDERWWGEDAKEFRPERWLQLREDDGSGSVEGSGGKSGYNKSLAMRALTGMGENGAYIPFGAGQRVCIGTGFAIMEAVLVLATILQKFELKAVPGSKGKLPRPEPIITLRPQQVRLLLGRRKRKVEHNGGDKANEDNKSKSASRLSNVVRDNADDGSIGNSRVEGYLTL